MSRARGSTTLNEGFAFVDRVAQILNLPGHIREEACQMFRRSLAQELIKGRRTGEVAGACVYAASRRSKVPVRIEDVASALSLKRKAIARCYRTLFTELRLSVPLPDSYAVLDQLATTLALDHTIAESAREILEKAHSVGATFGKNPAGLAASALYIASQSMGGRLTQKAVAEAAGVTEVTVRNGCRTLERALTSILRRDLRIGPHR
jgi:transcription initiation factor TFIIB